MQLLSDISRVIQQPCWTNIELKIHSCHQERSVIKVRRKQGEALCLEMFYHNMKNPLGIFLVQSYLKIIKKKSQGIDLFSFADKYLVQPLPLEWNSNLYENCNDPCEVDVTHDLWEEKAESMCVNNSIILTELLFPEKQLKQFPDNSLCQISPIMLLR